jgi:CRISPR-associated endonuclease Csn1
MSTTLGLDIGTNSIGWCLVEDKKRIIDIGVRIFPVGVKEDDFAKTGTEVSKNTARRIARGARRLNDRYKLRRKQLKKLLLQLDMMPTEEMIIKIKPDELYVLRKKGLDKQINLKEFGRILLLLNQRRGFRSNKKDAKTEAAKKEKSEYLQKMDELYNKVKQSNCRTVGEYFYSLFEQNKNIANWHNELEPVERIRTQFIYRKLYEDEFDKLWDNQKKFYNTILTDENKKKIKDNCIYYQRPLKSQKHLVRKCRFEPTKRVAPRSSFEFQEFRIWQTLNNIRLTYESRLSSPLTLEEKLIIAEKLSNSAALSHAKIKECIGLKKAALNDMPEKIKGNTTSAVLRKALGEEYYDNLNNDKIYRLWHTLFFATDADWLYNHAIEKLGLDEEQAKKYADIDLEPDYGNISTKAINKILPFLKEGYEYAKACELAGYHHSYDEETDSKDRTLDDKIIRKPNGRMDEIDELRNPIVQQALGEMTRLINAIIAENGKPDKIRVELARELKKPKNVREAIRFKSNEKARLREKYIEFLKQRLNRNINKSDLQKFELWLELEFPKTEFDKIKKDIEYDKYIKFAKNVKSGDLEKYKLYLECGRISPYTGNVISLEKLFSPDIEIEHIIPYSKFPDDSFMNKTLSERTFNQEKGNRTAMMYFKDSPDQAIAFKERIKFFNEGKQERFMMEAVPEDFLNSQLTNNAYIARQARKVLKKICRDVYITNGQVTSQLRRFWQLNDILNPDGKNEKSRHDHRHHAIDALVVAFSDYRKIQNLSIQNQFNIDNANFPEPFTSFKESSKEMIDGILVSHRNKKRLLTARKNKYTHSKNPHSQNSFAVRGPLHEETIYGQIKHPETGKLVFVVRKPVSTIDKMKQIEKIIDKGIREILKDHIMHNGGESKIKEAMKLPVYIQSRDKKKKIKINSVRMLDPAEQMIQLRPNENPDLFVSSGNNFLIAVYENTEDLTRSFVTITFFDAIKNKINNLEMVPKAKDEKQLLFSLSQNDLVLVYNEHIEEINWKSKSEISKRLFRVIKFDVTGQIFLGKHNVSKIDLKKDRNVSLLQRRANTLKAVKVKLTTTGKLLKLYA